LGTGFADWKMPVVQLRARQTLRMEIGLKVKSIFEVADTTSMINTVSTTLAETKDFV
jgi:hypothetical protein